MGKNQYETIFNFVISLFQPYKFFIFANGEESTCYKLTLRYKFVIFTNG